MRRRSRLSPAVTTKDSLRQGTYHYEASSKPIGSAPMRGIVTEWYRQAERRV